MTYGKTNNWFRVCLSVRFQAAVAMATVCAFVSHALVDANLAHGQSPISVIQSEPEVPGEFQTPNVTAAGVQPFQLAPFSELVSDDYQGIQMEDASVDDVVMEANVIDVLDSGLPISSPFEALDTSFEGPPCTFCAMPQTLEIRKNVLGCRGCYQILPQDEIWVVSVRGCSCDPENADLIKVQKLENNSWQSSDLNALSNSHQTDTSRATMVYVHGNQTNYEFGITRGFQFYDNLFVNNPCPRTPVRLVLWLWESERELPRLYSDYLFKSRRAMTMGKTLTKTLNSLGNRQVAIVGFSLGAQVVLSSLEQMERAQMEFGCDCEAAMDQKQKFNVVLIAPALDPNYVCDVSDRFIESSFVSRSSIIVNSDDRAVKAMRFVIRHECPEARGGFAELVRCNSLPLGKTQFFEVSQEISRKHAIRRYTKSPTVQREMCAVLGRTAAAF